LLLISKHSLASTSQLLQGILLHIDPALPISAVEESSVLARCPVPPTVVDYNLVLDWGLVVEPGQKASRVPVLNWSWVTVRPDQI